MRCSCRVPVIQYAIIRVAIYHTVPSSSASYVLPYGKDITRLCVDSYDAWERMAKHRNQRQSEGYKLQRFTLEELEYSKDYEW